MNLVNDLKLVIQSDVYYSSSSSSLDGWSTFFLVVCCCSLVLIPILLAILFNFLHKISQASDKGRYVPGILSRIWYRTILITPRGLSMLFVAVFGISLSFISIDFSFASTAAIFMLLTLIVLWFYAQVLNIYLFFKSKILKETLIDNNINIRAITRGEKVKVNVRLKTPFPIGFILKMTVILPPELGGEIRSSNATQKKGFVNLTATLPRSRRGQHEVGPIVVEYQDLFGFTSLKLFSFHKNNLTIYPKVKRLRKLAWQSASRKYGDDFTVKRLINSDDFFDIREYRRGDDVRKIHWKMTAKTDDLMLRIPEITYVKTGNFLLLMDNLIPGNYSTKTVNPIYGGSMDVLDKIIEVSGSIIDFTLKNGSEMKVIYHHGYNKVKLKQYHKTRREEWLEHMSGVKWKNKTSKSQAKVFDLIMRESKTAAGIFIVTSEIDSKRYEYLSQIKSDIAINIIYVDPATFLNYKEKKRNVLGNLGKLVLSKPYLEQFSYFDNLLHSKLTVKSPTKEIVESIKKNSDIMYANLRNNFKGTKYIDKYSDYISVLEREL